MLLLNKQETFMQGKIVLQQCAQQDTNQQTHTQTHRKLFGHAFKVTGEIMPHSDWQKKVLTGRVYMFKHILTETVV